MGTLFWVRLQGLARVGDWSEEPMNKKEQRERAHSKLGHCQHGLPRVGRPQEQTVWQRAPVGSASEDHVLGGVFLHDGQAQKSGARVRGVAQMRHDRVSQAPRQRPDLEPSDRAIACPQDQWVSPLPSHVGSPDVGE